MIALFTFLTIIALSITVIRIGAIALELTGLSSDVAAFQAQSAFSGTGFTTTEAESIVNHPVRRRIIRILILFGSAGLTSSIATFVLTFIGQSTSGILARIGVMIVGVGVLFFLSRSRLVDRLMKRVITRMLESKGALRVVDYQEVFGLKKGYSISRFQVRDESWMTDRTLADLRLRSEGILVFAIHRNDGQSEKFVGVPNAETTIRAGDVLICYGQAEAIRKLSDRGRGSAGDREHDEQVEEEQQRSLDRDAEGATLA